MELIISNVLIIVLLIKIIVLWIVIYNKIRIIKEIEDFYEDYIRNEDKKYYNLKSELDNLHNDCVELNEKYSKLILKNKNLKSDYNELYEKNKKLNITLKKQIKNDNI